MTGYQKFDVLREALNLHPCGGCGRRTTGAYCCGPCANASQEHYEIHEDGPLGHTSSCNDRHAVRSLAASMRTWQLPSGSAFPW